MTTVTLRHKVRPRDRFADHHPDVLAQAVRNVAPNMWPMDLARLEYQHPHVVRDVEREYARLMGRVAL